MIVNVINSTSASDTEKEQIKRNIEFYCRTPRGSLPQMRGYGLDFSAIDKPLLHARRQLTVDIITGLRDEFNITVQDVKVSADADGKYIINITI